MAAADLNVVEVVQLQVGGSATVAQDAAPKNVLDGVRRKLKQFDRRELLQLVDGRYELPSTLLPLWIEFFRRFAVPYQVQDVRVVAPCAAVRHRLVLDEKQQSAVQRLLLFDAGMVAAQVGVDYKAVVLEMIMRRQQRCLIVSSQRGQWDESDTRVVVASLEELNQSDDISGPGKFGFVVFDAIETYTVEQVVGCLQRFAPRYVLGAAHGRCEAQSLWGDATVPLGQSQQRTVQLASRHIATQFEYSYAGRDDYQALLAALALDPARNHQIIGDIVVELGRDCRCLVLSERRDHLEQLAVLLSQSDPAAELNVQLLTSSVSPTDRLKRFQSALQSRAAVVLATIPLALELDDLSIFSRLFLTFPFSYSKRLEDLVAQVLRPARDKVDAIIYDYDDVAIVPLHRAFQKRAQTIDRLKRVADEQFQNWAQLDLGL